MPSLSGTKHLILVTGANGFLGTWIVHHLLEKGYWVRAAVRNEAKGQHLLKIFEEYGEKLELSIVGDIIEDDAFKYAIRGVDGVIHTASPVTTSADNPKQIIDPAVKGVTGIMRSAFDHGSQVQRIVFTSSCAAILDTSDREITVSEKDWNDQRVEECERFGKDASGLAKYSASKVLAERAAWGFYAEHRNKIKWDIAVINPPYIFGPILHDVSSPKMLNSSSKLWYDALVRNDFHGVSAFLHPGHGWADVRDVAEAHVKALESPSASGERIIVYAGSWVWQDMINAAFSLPSSIYSPHPDAISRSVQSRTIKFDSDKAGMILGLKYRSIVELCHDTLADFAKNGWYPLEEVHHAL